MSNVWKKVVVFLGSTRNNRIGDRVGKFVCRKLKEKNLDVIFVDPVEYTLPLLNKPCHFYRGTENPPQQLSDMDKHIIESDAIVVVSAEYNHSIPPALSNTLDHFGPRSYERKPSAIITYSPSVVGGARAGMQLRAMLGELGCISISNMFTISQVHKCFDENGMPLDTEPGSHMDSGIERCLKQLEWWANAAKYQRDTNGGF
uniref:Uncharacterized protein LOC100183100 n=1 Tax=Phallusia mammillata TaxID=59560 RepID=A0A6F9DHU6_9ASCI|nr:uncharacterized protein LOC100183100 [Phallusia mammillata]